ncbi:MAG: acetate--CoA ligase family protein, partial [Anaerolineales bacterium]|nr:acetate--CoA ligase family protein [Anaerolineales bacterium]
MKRIFYPDSIVVIGVSERPDNLAKNIIGNLLAFDFKGPLYAVGRRKSEVHGIPIEGSLNDVPDGLDLAVILTPAHLIPEFVDQCAQKGILRVVVESGGFSEFSDEGVALEEQLLKTVHQNDMRLVGPNCLSVVNLEAGVCLPFGIIPPERFKLGKASIISQSGGVSLTVMGMLGSAGVGTNKAVSIGNKSDLDESDYLEYFLSDDGTRMVCMYLESISDGRRLLNLASRSSKPIITQKANRSVASQTVAFSHTAALANDDRIVDAAFKQTGIIRADDFEDLKVIAQGLTLPPVKGKNLVIISRSGGHAVTAADLAERHGFNLPPLPESFMTTVRDLFRADVISITNPLDLGVIYDFDIYAQIVEGSLNALSPDAVLLINTYGALQNESGLKLAKRLGKIARDQDLPIALCLYADMADASEVQEMMGFPIYEDIDSALRGLACSRDWYDWSSTNRKKSDFRSYVSETEENAAVEVLSINESLDLCETARIPTAVWEIAQTPEGAGDVANRIGFPVALKLAASDLSHKSDVGAVAVGLADHKEVTRRAEQMLEIHNSEGNVPSFLVQEMVMGGVELLVGGKIDPTFGPVVSLGLGGILVEIYDDVIFRVAPLTKSDANSMIEELRGRKLLDGYRGEPPVDRQSIIQTLLSVSNLMMEEKDLIEFEINPLIATRERAVAVDARGLR